jgi:hypothetical protein
MIAGFPSVIWHHPSTPQPKRDQIDMVAAFDAISKLQEGDWRLDAVITCLTLLLYYPSSEAAKLAGETLVCSVQDRPSLAAALRAAVHEATWLRTVHRQGLIDVVDQIETVACVDIPADDIPADDRLKPAGHGISKRLRSTFAQADANRTGRLDFNELRNALRLLGVDTSCWQDVLEVLRSYDADGTNLLEIEEFASLRRSAAQHVPCRPAAWLRVACALCLAAPRPAGTSAFRMACEGRGHHSPRLACAAAEARGAS